MTKPQPGADPAVEAAAKAIFAKAVGKDKIAWDEHDCHVWLLQDRCRDFARLALAAFLRAEANRVEQEHSAASRTMYELALDLGHWLRQRAASLAATDD